MSYESGAGLILHKAIPGGRAVIRTAPHPTDRRWQALIVLCAGTLMIVLDTTVVNVALPAIQHDLRFSAANLAWVMNAYLIAFGGLMLLAGRLGDLLSRRGIFLAGLALFTAASLACGLAPSAGLLVAARFVQGVGGAMTAAVTLGMIVTMFPEPREQARAIGVYGFVASGGGTIGLLVGGAITQAIDWHWIFFVNLPIGVVTGVLARRLLDHDRGAGLAAGADVAGAVLITSALMLAVYTIVGPAAQHGWGAASTLAWAAAAVILLGGFVLREARAAHPLIPLRIFRSRTVAGANLVQALVVAGMFSMFFLGSLYLQHVLGFDALQIGLAFLPTTLIMGTLSLRYSENLMTRFGPRATLLPGLVLIAAGLGLLARVPVHGSYVVNVLPTLVLLGTGIGVSFPSLMTLAMSGATPADAGLASGLVNTTVQIGGALGLAALATLAATHSAALHLAGRSMPAALTGGYQLAFAVGAGLVVLALLVSFVLLRPPVQVSESEPQVGCGEALACEAAV
jgi:EmrB/QacA subfamily drug resistance transporter